jgi:nucleoside-diphosphate-sugar epimerase
VSLRVAVTGASGFIGQHVTRTLAARGDAVTPIRRPFEGAVLTETFRHVDVVVHLAGVIAAVREREFVAGNVVATQIVAEAARDAKARLVHISSLAAAGPAPASAPRSEDDPATPITPYGRTKHDAEQVIAGLAHLRWTILRPGVVYGPGDHAMLPLFRWARLGAMPVVGRASAAYTFIYIDDLVRAILAAIDRDRDRETIFVGHERPVTPRQLLEQVRATLGSRARLVPIPRAVVRAAAAAGNIAGRITGRPATINRNRYAELYASGFVCRVDRMRDRLGVVADTDLEAGFAKSREWYVRRMY